MRGGTLRWETHAEFTTYSWDAPPAGDGPPSLSAILGADFVPPGPLMVATRLDLVRDETSLADLMARFDPGSIAVSGFRDQRALGITDFQPDATGMTRITLIDRGLAAQEIGPLVQRLIEIETYRTLALLGLPEARQRQPAVARVEAALIGITQSIGGTAGLSANRQLLEDLTALAAELEAGSSASAYRFGATRAYAEIVRQRLASVREGPVEGYSRWTSFLERRMAPALRTCESVEKRQDELSERLGRAANLLRTRIEVELEQQNRELLAAINRRARMQLRLQQTVEGLSVAAVSYYVVGLIGYIAKGVLDAGHLDFDPAIVTAAAVPPVMLIIWLLVRRIRARHGGEDGEHS
jgi:uncharacterized membrane-anchored protein